MALLALEFLAPKNVSKGSLVFSITHSHAHASHWDEVLFVHTRAVLKGIAIKCDVAQHHVGKAAAVNLEPPIRRLALRVSPGRRHITHIAH